MAKMITYLVTICLGFVGIWGSTLLIQASIHLVDPVSGNILLISLKVGLASIYIIQRQEYVS